MPRSKKTHSVRKSWQGAEEPDDTRYQVGKVWCDGQHEHHGLRSYFYRDNGKCAAHLWDSGQCGNTGKLEFEGLKFCGHHYPPKIYQKRLARDEWSRIESATRRYYNDRSDWSHKRDRALIDALIEIANAHLNDPVGFAQMKIEEWREQEPRKPVEAEAYERKREADRRRDQEKREAETRKRRDEQDHRRAGEAKAGDGSAA